MVPLRGGAHLSWFPYRWHLQFVRILSGYLPRTCHQTCPRKVHTAPQRCWLPHAPPIGLKPCPMLFSRSRVREHCSHESAARHIPMKRSFAEVGFPSVAEARRALWSCEHEAAGGRSPCDGGSKAQREKTALASKPETLGWGSR
jgi:hypothetical protein